MDYQEIFALSVALDSMYPGLTQDLYCHVSPGYLFGRSTFHLTVIQVISVVKFIRHRR